MNLKLRRFYAPDAGAGGGGGGQQQNGGGSAQSGTTTTQQQAGSGSGAGGSVLDAAGGGAQGGKAGGASGSQGGQQQSQNSQQSTQQQGQQNQQAQKPGVPEKYEFKAPEGSNIQVDAKAIEAFSPIAKELGLTQEAFGKVAGWYAQHMQAQQAQARTAFAERVNGWRAEASKIPAETLGLANRALNQLADPQTKALFHAENIGTNFGDWMGVHPGILNLLAKAGALLKEDTPPGGSGGGAEKPLADLLYDKTSAKK